MSSSLFLSSLVLCLLPSVSCLISGPTNCYVMWNIPYSGRSRVYFTYPNTQSRLQMYVTHNDEYSAINTDTFTTGYSGYPSSPQKNAEYYFEYSYNLSPLTNSLAQDYCTVNSGAWGCGAYMRGGDSGSYSNNAWCGFANVPAPTPAPIIPTPKPTRRPTNKPTPKPTSRPTAPTTKPTSKPTSQPTARPTPKPTSMPKPTRRPTNKPTPKPTSRPTAPTTKPTSKPTSQPTARPTPKPTSMPTPTPTVNPSYPTKYPTYRPTPTRRPTNQPTHKPTDKPKINYNYDSPSKPDDGLSTMVFIVVVFGVMICLVCLCCRNGKQKRQVRTAVVNMRSDVVPVQSPHFTTKQRVAVLVPQNADIHQDPLPSGWRVAYTADGKMYYQNSISKVTQWQRPTEDM
eukprot:199606_1